MSARRARAELPRQERRPALARRVGRRGVLALVLL